MLLWQLNLEETEAIELVVQGALHSHSADAPELSQANTLAVSDSLHVHT